MPKLCPVCGTSYPDTLVFCPADASTLRAADVQGDLIGSVVADRYLVTGVLGEGGMGTVYLARHVRLPQQAAIKVLRKDMLRDAAAVARFNREAANASRIDHDRVARVYDFGETADGVVYLAMEFIQGKTLKAIVAEHKPMDPERAARIVRQIGEALDAAHRMEIVHRDLKPDNVMIIEDADGTERVKVVDFGIAKAFGTEDPGAGLTRTGFIVGTPEFMSPEQLLGSTLDARSDIYALAIVAYQCLTGDLPFSTNTPDHGMAARLMTPARSLLAVSPETRWPLELQAIFDQALAREPELRQTSAGAFAKSLAAAIDRWQNGEDSRARGGRRASEATAPVVSPSVPPPTSPAAPTPWLSATPHSAAPAVVKAGGASRGLMLAGIMGVVVIVAGAGWFFAHQNTAAVKTVAAAPAADSSPTSRAAPSSAPVIGGGTPTLAVPTPTASVAGRPIAPPVPPPPSVTGPMVGAAPRPAAAAVPDLAATRTLDSVTKALDPTTADEGAARAAIPVLRALLPRLVTADDSTWAEVRLAEAHLLVSDARQACVAIRVARSTARSKSQRDAVQKYDAMLSCGS